MRAAASTPRPTHGDGLTATCHLEPRKCFTCKAELLALPEEQPDPAPLGVRYTVACPNGCEEFFN